MKLMNVKDPAEVMQLIDENFRALPAEMLPFTEAGGRYLAEEIYSPEDVPGFNRSTVDGYAVKARDIFGAREGLPAMVECRGEILMGQASSPMQGGDCYQIHTGGMLPEGADAVIMVEDTELLGNTVQCYRQVAPGENVIHRGEDVKNGQLVLDKGKLLRPPELGVLASLGITEIKVYRQPVTGLLPSGDELVPWDTKELKPGQIRNSNGPALASLARQSGAQVIQGGILPDKMEEFLGKSNSLLKEADFLVFSGGSSVGTRDFTALTMNKLGKPGLLVEGISIQPGKPTLLANCNGKPVLGLPGHPVSALYVFMIFGSYIIRKLSGAGGTKLQPTVKARLARNVPSRSGRTDYVRVKLRPGAAGNSSPANLQEDIAAPESMPGVMLEAMPEVMPEAIPIFGRSGMLRTLAEADGYFIIPPEKEGLLAGEKVAVFLIE